MSVHHSKHTGGQFPLPSSHAVIGVPMPGLPSQVSYAAMSAKLYINLFETCNRACLHILVAAFPYAIYLHLALRHDMCQA